MYDTNGPVYSSLTSKVNMPATLALCQGSTCNESASGNLCNLAPLNGCPNAACGPLGSDMTGQNETGSPPAVLVCCSDIGFAWGFSQAFLDEQDWSTGWCSDYVGQTCGNMPVNNYNRCQYLMFVYGPTEAGDYCDRIYLYTSNAYSSATVASTC